MKRSKTKCFLSNINVVILLLEISVHMRTQYSELEPTIEVNAKESSATVAVKITKQVGTDLFFVYKIIQM